MQTQSLMVLGLIFVFACVIKRPRDRAEPAWSKQFKGWQKVFGLVAVVMAMLIVLNPELLALNLLGDSAFFDVLVLALGLQMHSHVVRIFHVCVAVVKKSAKRLGIPSPGERYLWWLYRRKFSKALVIARRVVRIPSSPSLA